MQDSNLSKIEREKFIKILEELKEKNPDKDVDINNIIAFINDKKYGLVFEQHQEQVDIDLETKIPILVEDKQREIKCNDDKYNFLLEGDNLHSLKLLEKTYIKNGKGTIDVIYIDPPYNTGNKDFMYADKMIMAEDEYKHSKWLSFMDERLKLAYDLLSDDGVIFISIDDNEQANLKLLCDSIFGEENFIANFLWNKSSGGSSLSKFIRNDYEYVLCYSKSLKNISYEFLGSYSNGMGDSSLINKPNKYSTLVFPQNSIYFPSIENGIIENFKDVDLELFTNITINNHYNQDDVKIACRWKWSQSNLNNELLSGTQIISKSNKLRLRYIKDNKGSIIKPKKSITNEDGVNYTVSGSSELQSIFGKIDSFSYPKPISLIKYLIKMVTYNKKAAIILDFFAGSGTTGQAVMELNEEDGGNRKFILCTNNENNICEEVTYQRLKTVISGIKKDGSKYSDGIPNNLKYLKCDFINKDDEELDDKILDACIPLIELQQGIDIENEKVDAAFCDEDLEEILNQENKPKTIYIVEDILLSSKQKDVINENNIEIIDIPNYFYDFM